MEIDIKDLTEEITYLIGQIKDPQKINQTLEQLKVITEESVKLKKIQKNFISFPKVIYHQNQPDIKCLNQEKKCNNIQQNILHQFWRIQIEIVPTVPHCHLVQQIGLLIRYEKHQMRFQLKKQLPNFEQYKIWIYCKQGTHNDAKSVQKQINDKERVLAAFQNPQILSFLKSHTQII